MPKKTKTETKKKRKRTRKKPPPQDEDFIIEDTCAACGAPTIFDEEYCPACLAANKIHDIVGERLEARDVLGAVLGAAGSVVLQAGRPAIRKFVQRVVESGPATMGPQGPAQGQGPKQGPAQRKRVENPWPILGLDPKKATAADVKRMQRQLAALYHPDKGGGGVAEEQIARINAAADNAIAWLKAQGRG